MLGVASASDAIFLNMEGLPYYVGVTFNILHLKTYRHLGDSRGNFVVEVINRFLGVVLKRHGTNFIAVWEKRCRH